MHAPQHQVLRPIDILQPRLRGFAPAQKHHAVPPLLVHGVDDLLRKTLPAFTRVTVRLVRSHGEAGVQQEDAAVCPGSEETAVLGGRSKGWIVLFQGDVDVLEGRGSGGGRTHGEAEAVGLVVVVVGILAEDDGFHGVERCVAGPGSR